MSEYPQFVETPECVTCPECSKPVKVGKWSQLMGHNNRCPGGADRNGAHGATVCFIYEPTGVTQEAAALNRDQHLAFNTPHRGITTDYRLPGATVTLQYIGTYVKYRNKRYDLFGQRDPKPTNEEGQ